MDVQPRSCLKCGQPFDSTGLGNRICKRCARHNARIPITPEQLQRQRGAKRRNGEVLRDPACDELARGPIDS